MKIGIIIPYYENQSIMRSKFEWLITILKEQKREFEIKTQKAKVEIIVVDDGSNAQWLDYYNNYFTIMHLNQNKGVSEARNFGLVHLKMLKPDYIGFLDADDSVSSDYIEQAYRLMKKGYDFIDSRFVQEGQEIFGSIKNYQRQHKIIRGGVAGCFFKASLIGDKKFDKKLQIGEDTKFVNDIIDLKKHKKGVSMGIYIYNLGVNNDSLTMRYARGEIKAEFEQDFLTKEYYANQDSVDNGDKVLEYTFDELNEQGITLNKCFEFADKMGLVMEMPQPSVVVFSKFVKKTK